MFRSFPIAARGLTRSVNPCRTVCRAAPAFVRWFAADTRVGAARPNIFISKPTTDRRFVKSSSPRAVRLNRVFKAPPPLQPLAPPPSNQAADSGIESSVAALSQWRRPIDPAAGGVSGAGIPTIAQLLASASNREWTALASQYDKLAPASLTASERLQLLETCARGGLTDGVVERIVRDIARANSASELAAAYRHILLAIKPARAALTTTAFDRLTHLLTEIGTHVASGRLTPTIALFHSLLSSFARFTGDDTRAMSALQSVYDRFTAPAASGGYGIEPDVTVFHTLMDAIASSTPTTAASNSDSQLTPVEALHAIRTEMHDRYGRSVARDRMFAHSLMKAHSHRSDTATAAAAAVDDAVSGNPLTEMLKVYDSMKAAADDPAYRPTAVTLSLVLDGIGRFRPNRYGIALAERIWAELTAKRASADKSHRSIPSPLVVPGSNQFTSLIECYGRCDSLSSAARVVLSLTSGKSDVKLVTPKLALTFLSFVAHTHARQQFQSSARDAATHILRESIAGTATALSNDIGYGAFHTTPTALTAPQLNQLQAIATSVITLTTPASPTDAHTSGSASTGAGSAAAARATAWRIENVSTPADVQSIARLFTEYAKSLPIDLGYQNFSSELAELPGKYGPPHGALLLARATGAGGQPLGCVALRPLTVPGVCEMKRLYLVPAARGLGLGRALAESIVAAAWRIGYREMRLDTLESMHSAIALYEQMGFVRIPAYYSPTPDGTVFMSLARPPKPN